MLSKYSIYGGGRWREIDIETGRVAGWAGSNFVYTKRGNLVVLKSKSVLRGLKDLASGHISTVKDGFHLSQLIKKKKPKKSPKQIKCKCYYQHKHDVAAPNVKILQTNVSNASIQCNIVPVDKTLNNLNIRESVEKDVESIESTVSDNIARAITISESDVETFRSYIVHSTKNIFNVDLFMYDANDDYKRSVFYKITPIVKVQRHPIIQSLVRQKQFKIKLNSPEMRNKTQTLSKKTNYCEPKIKIINHEDNSDSEITNEGEIIKQKTVDIVQKFDSNVNKDLIENKGKRKAVEVINQPKSQEKRSRLNNSDSLKENIDNVQRDKFGNPINKVYLVKKWSVKNKRTRPTNEFSLLEDEAIVAWIVTNKKGNLVNGNRMWKEMEPIHLKVTGHYRSWHSLRNRYLRHLLPALGSLSLTPSQITDLRAAAATGELKAIKMNKNNSIYRTEPVRSAWSARPQKLQHSDDELCTPSRNLRSNVVSPPRSKLPTYSEITRRFAEKHRSTPNSEEDVTNKAPPKGNKTNKESEKVTNQSNKQPRVSLKIIRVDTNSDEEGSLRVVNIDEKQYKKTEEKLVSKSREKSSRYVSRREESRGVEKNRKDRKGNETDTDDENDLENADRSDLINKHRKRTNKDNSESEERNEKQGRNETRQENRFSRRLRHERSGVEDTLGQNRSKVESDTEQKNPKTRENRASRRRKSPERSITERSIGRRKNEDSDTEPENKKKVDNSRSSTRNREAEMSGVEKKNLRQRRNKSDSDSEPEKKKKDDNSRSSTRNREAEMSGVEKKNLRQRRNKSDSDSEPEKKKKDDNSRSSTRNREAEMSGVEKKNLRQRRNKSDSDSEPDMKKKDDNSRSSTRNREAEMSGVDKKSLRQRRNENDSDSEPEKKKKDDNSRSSTRNREGEMSGVDKKSLRQRRNENDSDSEPEKKKKDDNGRSSTRNRDEEMSGVEKRNLRYRKNKSDSEPEKKKKDDNGQSSTRNREEEMSGVDKKSLRQRRNKNDSDSEPENKKDSRRSSRRLEEERSSINKKFRQSINKKESNTENKSKNHQSPSSVTEQKHLKQIRNKHELDREETKKQDKERENRSSRRLRSLERSLTEKNNLRSLGNLEENEKFSRSKKTDKSDTDDKENGADNKMYLRQYRYKSGAELENAKTTKNRENGNVSKNEKNIHSKPVKVDRSKRKYIEISDSKSENEREKKNKRVKRSSGSDSDFVRTSKKETNRSRSRVGKQSDDSDFSVNSSQTSITSKSDFDSSNDNVKKRLTRQSHKVESGSRDNIIFEISDNDEAYASRSDTEVKNTGKRNLRKLFNHRAH
ncbi:trichohyalin-like isoform X3 [Pieris napi]|uniref:trichohyalin-like isoform X3 n=1 Tax=Pieris napi TaxID=78633 RepID=UPI001FBB145E|nr:trichohyalin-like isoform X3 [Pieris napi]